MQENTTSGTCGVADCFVAFPHAHPSLYVPMHGRFCHGHGCLGCGEAKALDVERPASPFADPTVETVYTFRRHGSLKVIAALLGPDERVHLVKRQDRHDDGSISTTYCLELTEDQYKALGGE